MHHADQSLARDTEVDIGMIENLQETVVMSVMALDTIKRIVPSRAEMLRMKQEG